MRTLVICTRLVALLCVVATTADAAPLYLKCEGKEGPSGSSDSWPALHSIKIEGAAVEVDGLAAGQIDSSSHDYIWSFGNEKDLVAGTVDRITGGVSLTFHGLATIFKALREKDQSVSEDLLNPIMFEGTCR